MKHHGELTLDDILTTAQAAKLLGVSVRTAQLWVESGDLPSWKTPGGHRRIPRLAVAELIAGHAMHHPAGATAVVLSRPGNATPWQALAKAGFLVEVIEDALQAAIRIGELLPSLIVIEDAAEPAHRRLLESLDSDVLLAPSLLVVRTKERHSSRERAASDRRHLVLDPDQGVAAAIEAILAHLKRGVPPLAPGHSLFPLPPNEIERLRAVEASGLLTSPEEPGFDRLIDLAIRTFSVPMAMFTLLTSSEQWFKARSGFDGQMTPREWAFCNQTLVANELTVFEDLSLEPQFAANPTVAAPHNFRFYAGAPVRDENGFALGSICIIDRASRAFSAEDKNALSTLADAASNIVKWRAQERQLRRLRATQAEKTGA